MSRITIINGNEGDDTVSVDGRVIQFSVDDFLPFEDVWAVQWYGDWGEVEYTQESQKHNERIESLDEFSGVIDEFNRQASALDDQLTNLGVDELKFVITQHIDNSVRTNIINGFFSSALGSIFRYSSDSDDQANITGNVIDAMLGESAIHFCYDADGKRKPMEHTPEQMIAVGRDLKSHIMEWQVKGANEKSRLSAVEDKASVIAFEVSL